MSGTGRLTLDEAEAVLAVLRPALLGNAVDVEELEPFELCALRRGFFKLEAAWLRAAELRGPKKRRQEC
jgi:hypothetical protein